MPSMEAPAWAFSAEAIDGIGDTHLPPGLHVRALPAPGLGVPATPLVVSRGVLSLDLARRLARTDGVTWRDSRGTLLTPPFAVTPDNPVLGFFDRPACIWAELSATAGASPGAAVGAAPVRTLPNLAVAQPDLAGRIDPARLLNPSPAVVAATAAAVAQPAIRFEAMRATPLGPAPFQSRSTAPWQLAAWIIPFVRVSGRGTVQGLRWLDLTRIKDQPKLERWRVWSLPVDPAPRYVPTPNAQAEAKDRVGRAAVRRQPMYVAYASGSPAGAPAATPGDAVARVDQTRGQLDRWLKRLLNDLAAPPAALTDAQAITGHARSQAAVPIEPFLLAGAVDPDIGHWLGFGDCDDKAKEPGGTLVFFRIRGLWRWDPKAWDAARVPAFTAAIRADRDAALASFPDLKDLGLAPREKLPFLDLHANALAIAGLPPDTPPVPTLTGTVDRGWLATPPPPDVRRALRLLAEGFWPHALAALAASDSAGLRTLNPFAGGGRMAPGKPPPPGTPLPIAVSRPDDADVPGSARLEDRDAPESPVQYRLAQGDWFGRWSGWAMRTAPAKARTPPMRPVIELFVAPPPPASWSAPGPLAGTVTLRIPVPRIADAPAGGAALLRLDLTELFDGAPPVAASYALGALVGAVLEPHAAPAHDVLVVTRSGPALARTASRRITYTARWVDVLGHVSADSDPASRVVTDPRPPPAPAVITELRYTARPDAMGHARVDLDFGSTAGTRYRVFGSTEPTLLAALDGRGETAAAAAIRAAAAGAPRAMAFRDRKALFGWDDFENLTPQPIVATGPTTRFVHRVSGSLEVLAIYRVLAEGPSGALSDMAAADLVPFAVPNLGGPARPLVSVLLGEGDPITEGVTLRVKVPAGRAVPVRWRLRRASVPVRDPLQMRPVAEGAVAGAVADGEGTSFQMVAAGPLKPWRQYRFAVEVQAGPPPGAPTVGTLLPGEWSEASAPATLTTIPPMPPAAPSAVTAANAGSQFTVTVTHPAADSLVGTAIGPHRFEVWRTKPGARPVQVAMSFSRGPGATWVASEPLPAPVGTIVSVRILDPLGRPSGAVASGPVA